MAINVTFRHERDTVVPIGWRMAARGVRDLPRWPLPNMDLSGRSLALRAGLQTAKKLRNICRPMPIRTIRAISCRSKGKAAGMSVAISPLAVTCAFAVAAGPVKPMPGLTAPLTAAACDMRRIRRSANLQPSRSAPAPDTGRPQTIYDATTHLEKRQVDAHVKQQDRTPPEG